MLFDQSILPAALPSPTPENWRKDTCGYTESIENSNGGRAIGGENISTAANGS